MEGKYRYRFRAHKRQNPLRGTLAHGEGYKHAQCQVLNYIMSPKYPVPSTETKCLASSLPKEMSHVQ